MGGVKSKKLSEVSQVREKGTQIGLFATEDIEEGTYLEDIQPPEDAKEIKNLSAFMNDIEFTYPKSYNVKDIQELRNNIYLSICSPDKKTNNVIFDTDRGMLKAVRLIKKDEEITKPYTLQQWSTYLHCDVRGKNLLDKSRVGLTFKSEQDRACAVILSIFGPPTKGMEQYTS